MHDDPASIKNIETPVDINPDLAKRVVVDTTRMSWEPSPSGTVWRKPLYRRGGEHGPVTSIVRYTPGGSFPLHAHPEGEEILVLDGVLADEHGEYPSGSFLLNPEGTKHAPRSEEGCILFVRLRQYGGPGRSRLFRRTARMEWMPGMVSGLRVKPLYAEPGFPENVALVQWAPGTRFHRHTHPGGEEILVLDGELRDEHGVYPQGTWLRNPHLSQHTPFSNTGCLIYVRVGGLEVGSLL
jgi:anti-sigma factor ChrR (cupin superfamily)